MLSHSRGGGTVCRSMLTTLLFASVVVVDVVVADFGDNGELV